MGISKPNNIVPNILFNRAIQFNSPFSRILYDSFISDNLTKYFIKHNVKQNTIREKKMYIIREIYNAYYNIGNQGHELFLKSYLLLNYLEISIISNFITPFGTCISATSPTDLPNNPLPIGLFTDILPEAKSASPSATKV